MESSSSDGPGNSSSSGKKNATGSALLSDIREGAERLAEELDNYLAKDSKKAPIRGKDAPPLSDEQVADLQLATARKLREVRAYLRSS